MDVVVIGAGFGGLAAAVELAAAGRSVRVLEAGDAPGGKAAEVEVDGVRVDTGPTVLTLVDVLDGLLQRAGTTLRDEVELLVPEPSFAYHYPDGRVLHVHHDPAHTADEVGRVLGADARRDFDAYLGHARRIWEVAAPWFVHGDAPDALGILRAGPRAWFALTRLDGHRGMSRAIRGLVRDPALRDLFARYATYNGSDPRRAPATLSCIAWVELALGGYGVRGGMHALARALAATAERLGVQFSYGAPVARIEADSGGVRGVRTVSGERIAARAVVCNADVAHLVHDLLPEGRSGLSLPPPSMSGWVGILRAERRPRAAHTVLFPRDYDQEFADVFDRRRVPEDPTVYLCALERACGRAGWEAHEPVFAMVNAPPVADADPELPPGHVEAKVEARLRSAGLWDPGDRFVWRRTPHGLARRFPRTGGALYGAASNSPLAAFRRPPNRIRAVPGLYLASGSAHPGGGVPLCVLSGRAAARACLSGA